MSCLSPSDQELEAIRRKLGKQELNESIISLLRGGVVVKTSIGTLIKKI